MTSKSWAMVLGVLSSIFLVHSQPQHLSLSKLHLSALACSFFFYFYDISFIIIWRREWMRVGRASLRRYSTVGSIYCGPRQ